MIETRLVFNRNSSQEFDTIALEIFRLQAQYNPVYKQYLQLMKCNVSEVISLKEIPSLPIEFFKSHDVITTLPGDPRITQLFTSSGTTGAETSRHHADIELYNRSFMLGFEHFYGRPDEYVILALLPSYLERTGSSLVYMMNVLIKASAHTQSGFYLHDHNALAAVLEELKSKKQKTILLGVTYALLDFVERHSMDYPDLIVMETGGMKGRREEMIREEVHAILRRGFGVTHIHSEYGMTELLSQAYSKGAGIFQSPPWMKILVRQQHDLLTEATPGQTGIISVIDLANVYSCSFITTQDVGRVHDNGTFEVLGRTDFSDVRGCNLMVE